MPSLPTTTASFASTATEAQFKTFLSDMREFLAGLLGTTGIPADARTALGVSALTLSTIASALGYTPCPNTNAGVSSALGYTPGKNGATFTFAVLGTFNPNGVNIYATYGPGVYAVSSNVYSITPSSTTIDINASVKIYKLSKD